jgi:hypothetical protein
VLRTYADIAVVAAKRAARSWLAALSIPIYALLFLLLASLVAPLGIVGGILVGIFGAACFGGYLTLLKLAVDDSPIHLRDLKDGLRAVWDVMTVFFVLWILSLIVGMVVAAAGSRGPAVMGVVNLAMAIFFNLIPELICHSRNRGVALLQESAWFVPNLIFAFVILWATDTLSFTSAGENLVRLSQLGSQAGVLALIAGSGWKAPLLIAFVHYVMVFRGLLYLELSSGNARMRAFRRRMTG